MKPRVIVVALLFAGAVHVGASVNETLAPAASESIAQSELTAETTITHSANPASGRLPTVAPDRLMPAFVASTPFADLEVATLPREIDSLPRESDALPQHKPQDANVSAPPPTPTPTPTPDRSGCDPAYPDERTCIPPGPPFDRGCAITSERRFTVLPPDPQSLDHDNDGIGCEPIR